MHYIRETTNIWALSLNFIYKMKRKYHEIGSEGAGGGMEKKPTTLRTLAKIPTFIESTQFFTKCFHYVEG